MRQNNKRKRIEDGGEFTKVNVNGAPATPSIKKQKNRLNKALNKQNNVTNNNKANSASPSTPSRRQKKINKKRVPKTILQDTKELEEKQQYQEDQEDKEDQEDQDEEEGDEEKEQNARKYSKHDRKVNRELTTSLFSDTFTSKINKGTEEEEKEEEDDIPRAAWVDEDDEVMVSSRKEMKVQDKKISGREYQEKLRRRHEALSSQSADWAKIKPKKSLTEISEKTSDDEEDSEDDGDAILYKSQPLVMQSTRLTSTTIDVLHNPVVHQHQGGVRRVSIHPVQPLAMTVDAKTIKIYQLGDKMVVMHSIKMLDMDITDACFSTDGSQVFMCGNQPSLYILEIASGKLSFLKHILGRKEKNFIKMCASPNGKYCALLGGSGAIVLISTVSKRSIAELRGPSNSVYSATFDPSGRLIASYAGGMMLIWNVETKSVVHSFTNPSLSFSTSIAVSPDNKYLALGSNVGVVDIFAMKDLSPGGTSLPSPHVSLDNLVTSINMLKFNHDSQLLAMGSDSQKAGLRLVHLPTFSVYQNWPLETTFNLVKDVSFSPNSGFLLTGEINGKIKMFRLPHFAAS